MGQIREGDRAKPICLATFSRRTGEDLELVGELLQQICRFPTLIGRERRRGSHLILIEVRFDRDYRVALGPKRAPAQPSELTSGGAEQPGDLA